LSGVPIRHILRRLDARAFHMSEYIFEARMGDGRLLATTLRVQGGNGAQPGGSRNVAGHAFLRALVEAARPPQGPAEKQAHG
jgi:hypothetical protein